MKRKNVCIIYTGGTIGMVPTENGYAPGKGTFAKQLAEIRDLYSPEMPAWDLVEFDPLLDSSNITFEQWNQIAETIRDNYDHYDGFVVLHGTDTMSYTASALSFMLEGLSKPVVLTGSQIPLCRLRSDGKDNLIASLMIAGEGIANEVCLYFGNTLMRGNRATKVSADELIAFASPNYPVLARAGIDMEYDANSLRTANHGARLSITKLRGFRIGVIKLFPGIQFDLFEPMAEAGLDGLILETFGAGNIPNNSSIPAVISKIVSHGTIVVVCTQCPRGSVRLGAYEAGAALAKAGALSGFDMTTEAAVTKLTYLLSMGTGREEIAAMMEYDLRGEMTVLSDHEESKATVKDPEVYRAGKQTVNVVCYGDSNTYGFCPEPYAYRYPYEKRWTSILAGRLGDGYSVSPEGLNGRTTAYDRSGAAWKNGVSSFLACVNTHKPVDILVIMLGTNDCLADLGLTAEEISAGMEELVSMAEKIMPETQGYIPEIIIVAPGAIRDDYRNGPFAAELDDYSVRKSHEIASLYADIAVRHGIRFVDATSAAEVSDLDAMHLSEQGHRELGELICQAILEIR
ncbi:MAG: asparaginase [Mogibacterium sp.]|nr:asparaginase [Mogibacterium sp.]